jgi:hypothetical protein
MPQALSQKLLIKALEFLRPKRTHLLRRQETLNSIGAPPETALKVGSGSKAGIGPSPPTLLN